MAEADHSHTKDAISSKPNEPAAPLNEKSGHANGLTGNGDDEKSTGKQEDNNEKPEEGKQEDNNEKPEEGEGKKADQPKGGFSNTPIPERPRGYTLKITMHRATNLPIADINSLSSDPYVLAQLNTDTPHRHKEDPPLRFRTHTVRKDKEPVWDEVWYVANVPASGFKLKLRIYDEDPADRDDKLGRIHITVPSLDENWPGIKDQSYKILARGSSVRAYTIQALTWCFRREHNFRGELSVSIEMVGRTPEDGQHGRLYTIGPCRWIRHQSPMLGRLANIKDPDGPAPNSSSGSEHQKKQVQRYNFQANQMQLQGPVPAELYHRFVEFKPWVGRMFTSSGISGVVLGSALRHQHTRVYNFGRSTVWGSFPEPSEDLTRQFLDLVHYDQGGRIFTYILTLDALFRFTETGKEFGIDMLSKHTMHSDVSVYIAFSGEFFIRRVEHPKRPPPPSATESTSQENPPEHEANKTHPPVEIEGGPPDAGPPKNPHHYQLVIDNDSGTYRPNAKLLPLLKKFLAHSLPGLHIMTLDCNADADKQQRMKAEQRERKKAEGQNIVYLQGGDDTSSVSSSDEEDLDELQAGLGNDGPAREHGAVSQAAKDLKRKQKAKVGKFRRNYGIDQTNEEGEEEERERDNVERQVRAGAHQGESSSSRPAGVSA